MVNTKEMLPDEYSHYVLRYSAIRSGFCEYNLYTPPESRNEIIASTLKTMYTGLFTVLMERLELLPSMLRIKTLDYFVEQIDRFDMEVDSSGVHGIDENPHHGTEKKRKKGKKAKAFKLSDCELLDPDWDM